MILDIDIAHYLCDVIHGTTVTYGIQLPYPMVVLFFVIVMHFFNLCFRLAQ